MRRTLLTAALASLVVAPAALPHPALLGLQPVRITVDASLPTGPINRNLVGLDWKLGTGDGVDDLHPNLARADIAFQVAAKQDGSFDWSFGDAWVAEAKAAGAEPMLILNYMPPWLAQTYPGDPRDPTKVRPKDFTEWERIVEAGVEHFAIEHGVRWFEVWNEPDWAGFWQDSPTAFLETAKHTAMAVRRVEQRTGIDLIFGGPACLFPDPIFIAGWLAMMRSLGMRPEFVSWHYYGNYPFVGPDGREPSLPEPVHVALGHRNPIGGVFPFPVGIEIVRALTRHALAGTGWADPEFIIDEWNVSAGGFDLRHDTHEGAAFDAGVLAEFQSTGLDRAAFFISADPYISSPEVNPSGAEFAGDWGLVSWKGTRKPAWWTFWLWQRMAPEQITAAGGSATDVFWAVAARDPASGRLTVMLSSFLATGAHPHAVTLALSGLRAEAYTVEVRRLDPAHASAATPAETFDVAGPATTTTILLPANSVAFVELSPA
ncbi:MAG: hypothetical protein WEB06_05590 [Actinomycetota bacterium]